MEVDMKRLMDYAVVMALVGLVGAHALEAQDGGPRAFLDQINKLGDPLMVASSAQDGGIGAFLDWINKLSGPRMIGPAASGWLAISDDGRDRIRGSIAFRVSSTSDAAIAEPGKRINMLSGQATYERVVVPRNLEVALGTGVSLNRFGGDVDAFYQWSLVPIYTQLSFPTTSRVRAIGKVGFHYFFEFDATDFQPLTVDVSRDGGEWTPWFGLGLEIVWP
jgi:hypothetical protein